MNFALSKILKYCEEHTTAQNELALRLERETNLKTLAPQMISGPYQGRLLKMLCLLSKPKTALEIGTFTGYASLHIADGLPENGILHTIEVNKELAPFIKKYIKQSGHEEKIKLHIGDAHEIIPELNTTFDYVFIDAGKRFYISLYDLLIDKVNKGGLILIDNVLWSGKVVQTDHDKDTGIIHEFNEKIQKDDRVENILLPIRDGLLMAIKK